MKTKGAVSILFAFVLMFAASGANSQDKYIANDSHFHLTNYIQRGTDIHDFVKIMGDKVGRVALFGIPLQQQWSYRVDGDNGPKYYLDSDAPLYYYSFTDAMIAMAYRSLSPNDQARFEPMITGFNPTDIYAVDHIKRCLLTFPGVFSGIGEFSIHKEFVAAKIAGGGPASLTDSALDSIFAFVEESGLVVIFHNDINKVFPKSYTKNYLADTKEIFRRHPKATLIWAHCGLGRVVQPLKGQLGFMEDMLTDPTLSHVYFDISWDQVAKYIVASDTTIKAVAELINKHPYRFLIGTE